MTRKKDRLGDVHAEIATREQVRGDQGPGVQQERDPLGYNLDPHGNLTQVIRLGGRFRLGAPVGDKHRDVHGRSSHDHVELQISLALPLGLGIRVLKSVQKMSEKCK